MAQETDRPVVVAVGHDPVDAALEYAVAEARRRGLGVRLVHAVPQAHDGPEFVLVSAVDRERLGRQALAAAKEHALDAAGDSVPVTSLLVHGRVVPAVVSVAADAAMIVAQGRPLSGVRRAVTRSVTSGLASRAAVPVVAVPSEVSRDVLARDGGTVTVGVDVPERSAALLRAAAGAAAARSATLHVVHTWHLGSAETAIDVTPADVEDWAAQTGAGIRAVVDRLDEVEGVPVRIDVRHARPADALVDASRDSVLLVVGRHDPLVPAGTHLGPVARAVLQGAECPVMVADPGPPRRWRDLLPG
ncbi:universal stress protein [Nocardioides sp. GXQ0305]|uniref:universal stress protein n=1 Tax=Nocardioides sp. GXQ0305 TaxID=3423912 RepID=UPI003D7DE96E